MPTPVTPLVGRQLEWGRLQAVWQSASAGHPHLLVLSGEAGIGKTRLAEELFSWVARQDLSTARAACYAIEGELAYAPVDFWLHAEAIRSRLSSLPALWLSEVARFVPQILVEHPGLPSPGPLTERWQQHRLFEALARAMLAARQPLLLLLDDLQWCDQETLAWLHYLLRFDPAARLLIVGTLRAEELTDEHPLHAWLATLRHEGQLTQLTLEGLSAAETATLAAQLAGHDLDPDAAIRLYQETEGNALFVVETMRMAHEQVEAREGQASTEPSDLQEVRVLPAIQAVITARLAKLSPQTRELVTGAAVIGRAFSLELLAQLSKRQEDELLEALDELWQRRILREAQGERYDFSHAKLREVAYAELRPPRRRLLHRRVAEALERVYANNLDSVNGQIASHYELAGDLERAVAYFQRAAERARQVYANTEATLSYQRVLLLLKGASSLQRPQEQWREVTTQVEESLGDVFTLTGQFEEARNAYLEALALVLTHDHIRQAHLHYKMAQTWKTQRRFDEGLQAYSMAEAALEGEEAERTQQWWQEWIEIQYERIEIHYLQAQLHELMERVEKTRPVVERYGTQVQRAAFFRSLFRMSVVRDRWHASEEMLEYARSSLAAYLELKNETEIAWARFILGVVYLFHGDLDLAEEQLRAAQVMGEQTGEMKLQSRCLTYLTVLSRKRGQVEEAQRFGSQALAIAIEMQLPDYIALAKANLAWIAWRKGNLSEAKANALAALDLWRPLQVVNAFHWMALWPLIDIMLGQDELSQAVNYARRLFAPGQQLLPDALIAITESAIQVWDSGQPETARTSLQQAIALAREMGYL